MDEPGEQARAQGMSAPRPEGLHLQEGGEPGLASPHPSLVKQMDSTPITAQPVGELRGAPGQAPRGAWGCGRGAPCAELLPRLELAAQFGDALLFLAEGRQEGPGWVGGGERKMGAGIEGGRTKGIKTRN